MPTEDVHTVSLTLTRVLGAPVETVFAAFTDPAVMSRWLAPGDMRCAEARAVPQVGGEFHVEMRGPDGSAHVVDGIYREVIANERLAFSWQWAGSAVQSEVRVTLRALDGGRTELTVVHERFPDADTRDKHEQGWTGCLAKLEALYPA